MALGKRGAAALIVRKEKQVRALALRRHGRTLREIGEELDISYETARNWVNDALAEMSAEIAENAAVVRAMEALRLEAGLKRTMEEIETAEAYPDKAVANLVRLSESYRKLYGLDAPQRVDVVARADDSEIRDRIAQVLGLTRD